MGEGSAGPARARVDAGRPACWPAPGCAPQVGQPGYQKFLRYMCPGFDGEGATVPPGDDLEACPRPILGTYDDHDYGVNNLNRRLPSKHLFKQAGGAGWAGGRERRAVFVALAASPAGQPAAQRWPTGLPCTRPAACRSFWMGWAWLPPALGARRSRASTGSTA